MRIIHYCAILPSLIAISCNHYATDDPLRQPTLSILTNNGKARLDNAVEERVITLNEAKAGLRRVDSNLILAQQELDASNKAVSDLRHERRISQREYDLHVAQYESLQTKIREQQSRIAKLREKEAQEKQTQVYIAEAKSIGKEVDYLNALIDSHHQEVMITFLKD